MTHQPTPRDAACDFRRCVYASLSPDGFDNANLRAFLNHGLAVFEEVKDGIDPQVRQLVRERLSKAQDPKRDLSYRREDLLMAASFLR